MNDTILFRQIFPPPHDDAKPSRFGGLPLAGPDFVWPRGLLADGRERPLAFILQLDCAAAPRGFGLPSSGLLQVFLDLDWGAGDGFRILHQDAPPHSLRLAAPPPDADAPYGAETKWFFPWLHRDGADARATFVLPRWPFEPVALTVPPQVDEDGEAFPYWPRSGLEARLAQAQGAPPRHADWPSAGAPEPPFAAMPQDWRAVEWLAGEVLSRLRGVTPAEALKMAGLAPAPPPPKRGFLGALFAAAPPPHDPYAEGARLLAEQRASADDWLRRAAARDPFDAVADDERAAFRAWLAALPGMRGYYFTTPAAKSLEQSLAASPQAAARVPPEALPKLAGRHAFAIDMGEGEKMFVRTPVRMFGPPACVQNAASEMLEESDKTLLLELGGDEALGHYFGEGVYQFWISPADLATRRFERVVMTRDAY